METPTIIEKLLSLLLTTLQQIVVWMKADVAVALPSIEWHLTPY